MPSDDPIILDPPKSVSRISLIPQGIAKVKDVVKSYSTWFLAILLGAPDLYQAAASLGWLADEGTPGPLKWLIRGAAGVGLIAKFISQRKPVA